MSSFVVATEKEMIKTLRITGIIAAILAGILFVFPVVFGVRSDEQVQQLLSSPTVIDKLSKAKTDKTATNEDAARSGPLVKQAQAFALYLNPPESKKSSASQRGGTPTPRGPVEAKFTLMGTSFFAAHPELSLAFIDEPGKGFRWVRQSSQIGHLVIEQIKDGLIVVRDGQRTYDIAVQKSPNLDQFVLTSTSSIESLDLPGKSTISKGSSSGSIKRSALKSTSRSVSKDNVADITENATSDSVLSDEQSLALEKFIEKLKNLQKEYKSDKIDINEPNSTESEESNLSKSTDESIQQIEELEAIISDYQSERVSEEEAEKLNDLGEELQEGEPNQN
jgi:RNase H-fold protein (predicted Holliday junction resolvase)